MDRVLAAQRRYLAALRAAAARRPAVHANQLAALDRELALAAEAPDTAAYRASSGDLFELTRAAWLDRLAAHARVAAGLDDPWWAEACAVEHRAALAARGSAEWSTRLLDASEEAGALRARGAEALSSYARLCVGAVRWRAEAREAAQAEARDEAAASLALLRTNDPGFDGDVERLARYRWRTPWSGAGLRALRGWWDELGPLVDARAPVPPVRAAAESLAGLEEAARAWRAALPGTSGGAFETADASLASVVEPYAALARDLAGDDPVQRATRDAAAALVDAAAGAPTAQDALAVWVERGLLTELARAPLRAVATQQALRAEQWPEPLRAEHARASLAALAACRTPTEVDLVAAHAEACLGVEAAWNAALLAGLLAPLRAACARGWNDDAEAAASVAAAWDTARALTGAGVELTAVPRVQGFLRSVVLRYALETPEDLGAFHAEAGFEVLNEARTYLDVARADGRITALDEASIEAGLCALLGAPGPGAPGRVRLWDQEVALADLEPALTAPRRPGVPGMADLQTDDPEGQALRALRGGAV